MNTYYPNYPKKKPETVEYEEGVSPPYVLYPVSGIVWATIIAWIYGGGLLLGINFFRLGKVTAATATFVVAIFLMLLNFMLKVYSPFFQKTSNFIIIDIIIWMITAFAMFVIASNTQGHHISAHAKSGGKVASVWKVIGTVLLFLIPMSLLITALIIFRGPSYGKLVRFDKDVIYIAGESDVEDAQNLAQILRKAGFFDPEETAGRSIRLLRNSEGVSLFIPIAKWAIDDPRVESSFRGLGRIIIRNEFCSSLTIHFCNRFLQPQKTIRVEDEKTSRLKNTYINALSKYVVAQNKRNNSSRSRYSIVSEGLAGLIRSEIL